MAYLGPPFGFPFRHQLDCSLSWTRNCNGFCFHFPLDFGLTLFPFSEVAATISL